LTARLHRLSRNRVQEPSLPLQQSPEPWLTDNRHLLPRSGCALDVACGRGRHALWLAANGLATVAIDRDPDAVRFVKEEARRRGVPVTARVVDLETGDTGGHGNSPLRTQAIFDVIVVVHYLHRPLFHSLRDALRPGGVLVYETFTTAQAARGKPTNPAFLLEPGELKTLVAPLEILRARETDVGDRCIASIVARRQIIERELPG